MAKRRQRKIARTSKRTTAAKLHEKSYESKRPRGKANDRASQT